MKNLPIILGMALVTFLPRYLPFLALSRFGVPPYLQKFLRYIPAAALGAFIFPGVLTAIPDRPFAAVIGLAVAICSSVLCGSTTLTVFLAIIATLGALYGLS